MMDALFTPGTTVSISASTSTGRVALPTTGNLTIRVYNGTSALAFIKFGDSTVEAAATDTPIPAGIPCGFTPPANATHVAAILASGTGTVYFTAGSGI